MKTRHAHLYAFLLPALATSAAWAVRDPFWPIGYAPAPPPAPVTEAAPKEPALPQPPPKPAPPAEKPITDADWVKARKALTISGITKSVRPDTKETKTIVMINRRSLTTGDVVTFVNDEIRFQWKIEAISDKQPLLAPLTAVRVPPQPTNLSINQ